LVSPRISVDDLIHHLVLRRALSCRPCKRNRAQSGVRHGSLNDEHAQGQKPLLVVGKSETDRLLHWRQIRRPFTIRQCGPTTAAPIGLEPTMTGLAGGRRTQPAW